MNLTGDSALFGTSATSPNNFFSAYANRTLNTKLCEVLSWEKIRGHDVKSGTLTFCDNLSVTLGFTQKDLKALADHSQTYQDKYHFKNVTRTFENANRVINLAWVG